MGRKNTELKTAKQSTIETIIKVVELNSSDGMVNHGVIQDYSICMI